MTIRAATPYLVIVLAAFVLDQASKALVEARMALHEAVEFLPFLALFHSRNTGVAFSLLSGSGNIWLVLLVLIVIVFVTVLALRTDATQIAARLGFALVIGGALGNLADRLARGHVVDFIYFHTPVWSFAVFNLADAFITIGAGLVVLDEFLAWRRGRKARG